MLIGEAQERNMNKIEIIMSEVKKLPEPLWDEVLDFVQFLRRKMTVPMKDTLLATESTLKKDWLRPEEDEAWHDL